MSTERSAAGKRLRAMAAAAMTSAMAAAIGACSSVERTVYETLQNVQAQECERDFTGRCPERRSYDEYRRETGQ